MSRVQDWELLDPPAGVIAARIRRDPDVARHLDPDVARAMLGWAQGQDRAVYDACWTRVTEHDRPPR